MEGLNLVLLLATYRHDCFFWLQDQGRQEKSPDKSVVNKKRNIVQVVI